MAPGATVTMEIARNQIGGCDGKQGRFAIIPSYPVAQRQWFDFDNAGNLAISVLFKGSLSAKAANGSYTYTLLENPPLALDERVTMPRNYIATDIGTWDTTYQTEERILNISNPVGSGLMGKFYEACFGEKLWHAQQIEIPVTLAPDEERTITYTVRYTW